MDRGESTVSAYSTHLAKIALHTNMVPTEIPLATVEDYLYLIKQRRKMPSQSYFKFAVYSMRFAYRMCDMHDRYVAMPSIKTVKRLPMVLSKEEVKRLIAAPKLLKHRILLKILYGGGLRSFEARNLKLSDFDYDRRTIHIRSGKNKKDRYVPLSQSLIDDLKTYIETEKPKTYLFNGRPEGRKGGDFAYRYSKRGLYWAVMEACKKAEITKEVTVHTLRHTFATHLLEDGLDIVSIKELLGHSKIETTMIYLHVARCGRGSAFSPLDTLLGLKEPEFKHGICPYFVNSVRQSTKLVEQETNGFSSN